MKKTVHWTDDFKKYGDDSSDNNPTGGRVYGLQWRSYQGFGTQTDQIVDLLNIINTDPTSRRMMINSWNAAEIAHGGLMALPPCHFAAQFYIENGYLNCKWSQRSVDSFLGLAFNIASYALLTHLVAKWTGYKPGVLIGDLTNVHIYKNHFDQVREQISRHPYPFPSIEIPEDITIFNISDYTAADFELVNYQHHSKISAPQSS